MPCDEMVIAIALANGRITPSSPVLSVSGLFRPG